MSRSSKELKRSFERSARVPSLLSPLICDLVSHKAAADDGASSGMTRFRGGRIDGRDELDTLRQMLRTD